jgi:hypothetical protein
MKWGIGEFFLGLGLGMQSTTLAVRLIDPVGSFNTAQGIWHHSPTTGKVLKDSLEVRGDTIIIHRVKD